MSIVLSREEIIDHLLAFIRTRFLAGDPAGELQADTPLLEYGILTSLNTAILIAHLREEFGITVALSDVTPEAFRSVDSLSGMLVANLARR